MAGELREWGFTRAVVSALYGGTGMGTCGVLFECGWVDGWGGGTALCE